MPYIKSDKRQPIDELLISITEHISQLPLEEQDGALNYMITKLLKSVYTPSYFNYNRAVGLINCIGEEWYRRQIAPYEDKKILENGDV